METRKRSKKPQPWNQDLENPSTVLDKVYIDHTSGNSPVCAKLKTEHIRTYYSALMHNLPASKTTYERNEDGKISIKTNSKSLGKATINLYLTTGVVTVQGKLLEATTSKILSWASDERAKSGNDAVDDLVYLKPISEEEIAKNQDFEIKDKWGNDDDGEPTEEDDQDEDNLDEVEDDYVSMDDEPDDKLEEDKEDDIH